MSFIGIITNSKNEEYITKMVSKYIPIENIIFITDKNIANIKNVRFETIVINDKLKDLRNLKTIVANASYVVLNSDITIDFNILENLNLSIISYGFNSKSTFTVSSVSENSIIICLQRMITSSFDKKYEPQEFEIECNENIDIYTMIFIQIIMVIYAKNTTKS